MQEYSFDFSDIDTLKSYFRAQLDPKGTCDRIYFPPDIGDGYLSYYKISPEIFLLINNYKANTDISYIRNPIAEKDIILHFRKYILDHRIENDKIISRYSDSYLPGNMRCMDSQQGEKVVISKGVEVKSTMIVLKSSYADHFFSKSSAMIKMVDNYIKHSNKFIDKFYLSYKQSVLFDQIVNPDVNRVCLLYTSPSPRDA